MSRECTEELQTRSYTDAEGNTKEIYVPRDNDAAEDLYKLSIKSGINFSKYNNIPVKVTGENAPDGVKSFEAAGLRPLLLENIKKSDYSVFSLVFIYSYNPHFSHFDTIHSCGGRSIFLWLVRIR